MCLPFGQRSTVETGRVAGERLELKLEERVLSGHHCPADGTRLRALVRQLAQDLLEFGVGDAGPVGSRTVALLAATRSATSIQQLVVRFRLMAMSRAQYWLFRITVEAAESR